MHEVLCVAKAAGVRAVLLTRWTSVASSLNVSPTNKTFYTKHKFYHAREIRVPRRAEYQIWRRDL